jgi:hypothetical protein
MTHRLRLFALCLFLLPCFGGAQINTDFSSTELEIYLLKDSLVTTTQAMKVPLNRLVQTTYDPAIKTFSIRD